MPEREVVKCVTHADRPAVAACVVGGEPLCRECLRPAGGKHYCEQHIPAAAPAVAPAGSRAGPFRPLYLVAAAAVVATLWGALALLRPAAQEAARFYREQLTGMRLAEVAAAVGSFKKDMGRWPTAAEGLGVLIKQPATGGERWLGPYVAAAYMKGGAVVDAAGRPLRYRFDERGPAILAAGSDGVFGSRDDATLMVEGTRSLGFPPKLPGLRDFIGLPPPGPGR